MCKLFRPVLIGIGILLLMNTAAIGQTTNVSGDISTDTTWNIAGSPYEIIGEINIADTATLTIESGVIVNNPSDSYVRMVKGALNAQGAILNDFKIHNGSGNLVMDNVQMNSGRIDSHGKSFNITNSVFNSVIVFHLDSNVDSYLENNVFNDCGYVDIIMWEIPTRNVYVRYNCFNGEAAAAERSHLSISHAGTAELILHSNYFNNPNTRVFWLNDTSGDVDASGNYWATASPDEAIWDNMDNPNITATVSYNPVMSEPEKNTPCTLPASMIINNGDSHTSERDVSITLSLLQEDATEVSGEIITDIVWNLAGSPYTLAGDLQINNGVRLTIEDGVVVNNPDGYHILVYGTIRAQAVLNNPVVFNGVIVSVATAGTVIFDYAVFNQGSITNAFGFEHFTITNCRFNETSYLRINARTDSYFERNTLTNAGYVELIANTSSHDRDIYARWNSFYGKHPTLALKSCFKVSYEGSDRLVIDSNNFLDENNYGISLHFNTSTVVATNNHWGSTDPAVIAARINDSNDNASILGTVTFEPYVDVPYSIPPSPSDAVYMSFSNDGTTFSAWESYSASKAWTLTDGDGTKEVFAKLKDGAGNITTLSDSIILDTTAPTGTIAIDGGSSYCLTRDVSLALNSADTDYMQFSNDGVSYGDWEPYADSKDWLLTAGEGVKTVYVKLKDAADNVSTFNDTIVLDTTAPTGNLTVNGGNDYATTGEATLTLNSDNATYVCFSNDGVNYSSWESYLGSKTWTLSEGDGTKAVYVKYKDEAGNTFVVSQGIIYDTTAPNAPVLIDIGTTDNDQPTLDWQIVSDSEYYVLEYAANAEFNNAVLVDDIGPSEYEVQSPLVDGTWYWRVMAVDPAGNESDWSLTGHFTIDTSSHCYSNPEKPALISPANGAVNVSLRPVMSIQEPLNTAVCNYPLKIRWRISEDADFKGLVDKVNPESKDLTTYQPSNLILESNTTYYWKVRILGSQENNSEWSDVFSFTTQSLEGDDDGNGIQDEQEVDVSDDLDNNGKADSLPEENIKSFKTKEGNIKMGILPNNCDLTRVEALETDSVSDDGDKPTQVPYGLVSYRLRVSNYGDTATVKIYLSEPAPENAKWVFYDSLEGWQDFSNHAVFNNDRTMVTVQLKDGGYGDNDHIENKVIVDPSGIGIYGAGSSGGGSSGGGGCFITTVIPW